ncbi:bifunctional hydroxymethylpyrimidine kinase/phosphomethylpyrimidine kinase [Gryllotalpicola reticulitermitis]|uniref:Bifunctional hydroxymethylpyrimidine kinase/phosphomethylpyrimidine kinase n=1 Tax=Gryllotalpicola reticulitermitis TaxID=1184153 RepID=A0ABV8Q657_9MICO
MTSSTTPRVLSIAGSDPSGGAGVQADLKSIAANGGYGMAAIAALTAQNTVGVTGVHVPPPEFLRLQLDTVADDIRIDAVKIGMLAEASVIDVVADWLARRRPPIVVLDPVMVATSGARLLAPAAEDALRRLLRHADVVTPNLPELAVLAGEPEASGWNDALAQAARLATEHGVRVLVTGGHLGGASSPDALVKPGGAITEFPGARLETAATHGTGCSLSSALATRRARGEAWEIAIDTAKTWLTDAMRAGSALAVGHGNGPVDHFARLHDEQPEDHAAAWWRDCADIRAQIDALPFVTSLGDGTLDRERFRSYLAQDALYLREYAKVLGRASALAPSPEEELFWARCARGCLESELQLHTSWLGAERGGCTPLSRVNRAYLDHLSAAGPDYGTIVAAVLPCFWIYRDVGERLAARSHPEHPYAAWLATYADPSFAESTMAAIRWAGLAATRTDAGGRARMARAFRLSAHHELAFFAQ